MADDRTIPFFLEAPRDYSFGSASKIRQVAAAAAGSTFNVPIGSYLLTVRVEEVEIKRGAAAIATPEGTFLAPGTQLLVRVAAAEAWAVRSAGAVGVIELTPLGK